MYARPGRVTVHCWSSVLFEVDYTQTAYVFMLLTRHVEYTLRIFFSQSTHHLQLMQLDAATMYVFYVLCINGIPKPLVRKAYN